MTKPANTTAIAKATGLDWREWAAYLDQNGAKDLDHAAIAKLAHQKLDGKLDNPGWWAQSVAVAYEQHIGRREPGQRSDGTFEATVSKTFDCGMDSAMNKWLKSIKPRASFKSVQLAGVPNSTAPKRGRHWAVSLADGSRLNADAYPQTPDKTTFTITHTKLTSAQAAAQWKKYWRAYISKALD
jgi:hypothetical protein